MASCRRRRLPWSSHQPVSTTVHLEDRISALRHAQQSHSRKKRPPAGGLPLVLPGITSAASKRRERSNSRGRDWPGEVEWPDLQWPDTTSSIAWPNPEYSRGGNDAKKERTPARRLAKNRSAEEQRGENNTLRDAMQDAFFRQEADTLWEANFQGDCIKKSATDSRLGFRSDCNRDNASSIENKIDHFLSRVSRLAPPAGASKEEAEELDQIIIMAETTFDKGLRRRDKLRAEESSRTLPGSHRIRKVSSGGGEGHTINVDDGMEDDVGFLQRDESRLRNKESQIIEQVPSGGDEGHSVNLGDGMKGDVGYVLHDESPRLQKVSAKKHDDESHSLPEEAETISPEMSNSSSSNGVTSFMRSLWETTKTPDSSDSESQREISLENEFYQFTESGLIRDGRESYGCNMKGGPNDLGRHTETDGNVLLKRGEGDQQRNGQFKSSRDSESRENTTPSRRRQLPGSSSRSGSLDSDRRTIRPKQRKKADLSTTRVPASRVGPLDSGLAPLPFPTSNENQRIQENRSRQKNHGIEPSNWRKKAESSEIERLPETGGSENLRKEEVDEQWNSQLKGKSGSDTRENTIPSQRRKTPGSFSRSGSFDSDSLFLSPKPREKINPSGTREARGHSSRSGSLDSEFTPLPSVDFRATNSKFDGRESQRTKGGSSQHEDRQLKSKAHNKSSGTPSQRRQVTVSSSRSTSPQRRQIPVSSSRSTSLDFQPSNWNTRRGRLGIAERIDVFEVAKGGSYDQESDAAVRGLRGGRSPPARHASASLNKTDRNFGLEARGNEMKSNHDAKKRRKPSTKSAKGVKASAIQINQRKYEKGDDQHTGDAPGMGSGTVSPSLTSPIESIAMSFQSSDLDEPITPCRRPMELTRDEIDERDQASKTDGIPSALDAIVEGEVDIASKLKESMRASAKAKSAGYSLACEAPAAKSDERNSGDEDEGASALHTTLSLFDEALCESQDFEPTLCQANGVSKEEPPGIGPCGLKRDPSSAESMIDVSRHEDEGEEPPNDGGSVSDIDQYIAVPSVSTERGSVTQSASNHSSTTDGAPSVHSRRGDKKDQDFAQTGLGDDQSLDSIFAMLEDKTSKQSSTDEGGDPCKPSVRKNGVKTPPPTTDLKGQRSGASSSEPRLDPCLESGTCKPSVPKKGVKTPPPTTDFKGQSSGVSSSERRLGGDDNPCLESETLGSNPTRDYWKTFSSVKTMGSFDSLSVIDDADGVIEREKIEKQVANSCLKAGRKTTPNRKITGHHHHGINGNPFRNGATVRPKLHKVPEELPKPVADRVLYVMGPLLSGDTDEDESTEEETSAKQDEEAVDDSQGCRFMCGDFEISLAKFSPFC